MKVLVFDFRNSEKKFFESNNFTGFEFKFFDESLDERTKLDDEEWELTDAVCVYRSSLLTPSVLKKFKNLRIVATRSFGFNHIDLNYCTKNNIAVLNVPQYGERAVAEYAFGLIIALMRKIGTAMLDVKNHHVQPKEYQGKLLEQLTIGIIGCGKVGVKLAKIANFFNMNVLVSSYKEAPNFESFCNIVPFDVLLTKSDIIALHMPYTTETYQILGGDEFVKMKDGVFIINTSSVELIDLKSLYENIVSGKVQGAGLDILDSDYTRGKTLELGNETMSTKENQKVTSKLLDMPNVIITPHIAYNTDDSINYVLETTINNLRDFTKGMYTNRVC